MQRAPRRIVLLALPGAQALDVTGPLEVFSVASRLAPGRPAPYRPEVVGTKRGRLRTSSGLTLQIEASLSQLRGAIDTLLVCGGPGVIAAARDAALLRALRRVARRARRVGSVCTGAFPLAAAGLLDGRRATTHWAACDALASEYPAVQVVRDPIFVRDGDVWSSAGVTAGIDLALALVHDDLGAQAALEVARWLVVFVQRPGGQAQFSVQLAHQTPERDALREVTAWIADHLDADLSVPTLARRAAMSVRHFARAFQRELHTTPARYVQRARLEAARRALELGGASVAQVAESCGFGCVEGLERAFRAQLGATPRAYRARFQRDATRVAG